MGVNPKLMPSLFGPYRIVAVMAAVIAGGVFSAIPESLSDFRKTAGASEWRSFKGVSFEFFFRGN